METYKDILKAGDIFAIPLFIDLNEKVTKSYARKKLPSDGRYGFGRFIKDLGGGGVLIEIFDLIDSLDLVSIEKIMQAGRMYPPLTSSGIEFEKNRWRVIFQDPGYQPEKDSHFSEISLLLGEFDSLRVKNLKTSKEEKATPADEEKFEVWEVWMPNQLEDRIRETKNISL